RAGEIRAAGCSERTWDDDAALDAWTASQIAAGRVIGWFQGRMEWGARALGNRSIIADPRRADMRDIINTRIKFRERFRPFAPSVAVEALGRHGCGDVIVVRKAQYDLTREADVVRLYAELKPQVVIHLAAVVGGIGANRESPGTFFFQNVMMGALTMEHARLAGVEKF